MSEEPSTLPTTLSRSRKAARELTRSRQLAAALRSQRLTNLGVVERLMVPRAFATTNPSVTFMGSDLVVAVRTHQYSFSRFNGTRRFQAGIEDWRSDTWLDRRHGTRATGDSWINLATPFDDRLGPTGLEDPRIFCWRDELWGLWTTSLRLKDDWAASRMVMGRINDSSVDSLHLFDSPWGRSFEKNWAPFVVNDQPHVMYDFSRLEVYSLGKDGVELVHRRSTLVPALIGQSGSSQLVDWNGGWLTVTHAKTIAPIWWRNGARRLYRHRFVFLSHDFSSVQVSPPFVFSHVGVEFCGGLAVRGGEIFISFGSHDVEARILRIPEDAVTSVLSGL